MARPTNNHPRTFKGYVALERSGGPILWGTLRPDPVETRRLFERWNPMLTPVIVRVRLSFGKADHED